MARLDWEKKRPVPASPSGRGVNRKKRTTSSQRFLITKLHAELERPGDATVPEMAYDANLEIRRLSAVRDTRKRMAEGS